MTGARKPFSFKVVDYQPSTKPAARDDRDWIAEGEGWRVWRSGAVLMLQYQSGEQGGGLRSIAIDADDLAGLRDGSTTVDAVLIRHNAS